MKTMMHTQRWFVVPLAATTVMLATLFMVAALVPLSAQEQSVPPGVSGRIALSNTSQDLNLSLQIQATVVDHTNSALPSGSIVIEVDGTAVPFEVTSLEVAPVEINGVVAGREATLTAKCAQTGETLEIRIFDEDPDAVRLLAVDYHRPLPPGDCVMSLRIGETVYEATMLQCVSTDLKVEVPAQAE